MLTYPRFAKACYALFAVAVLAAILKVSVSGAEPSLLKLLPAVPVAGAFEPAETSPIGPEDPRLTGFSDDGGTERLEVAFSRSNPREEAAEGSTEPASYDPSVFRRPSLEGDSSEPVCEDLGDAPRSSRVVFPLPEAYFNSYDDTWGAARPQGGHEGSDLMSPTGTPEFAVTDGRLVAVAGSDEDGWNTLGGYTVMLEAAYSVGPIKKGDLFYYAHLDREGALPVGTEVRAGQRIGTVGDTGQGPPVTRGLFPSHLHFGWYDAELSERRSQAESGAMNPYPLLLWLEENGGAVSGGTDASYCQAPQGPNPTPSSGGTDWPIPAASGLSPDLDTGDTGSPSPAARKDEHQHDRPGRDAEDRPKRDPGDGAEAEQRPEDGAEGAQQPDDEAGGGRPSGEDEAGGEQQLEIPETGDEQPAEDEPEGEGQAEDEGTTEPETQQEKTKPLALRKMLEARKAAILRNRPSTNPDRLTPGERQEGKPNGEKGEDGREDGASAGERKEDPPEAKRRDGDRPRDERNAPVEKREETPKPSAPAANDSPERAPAPERSAGGSEAAKEPEPVEPPDEARVVPAAEPPSPRPANASGGPSGDVVGSQGAPAASEAPSAPEGEAVPEAGVE